MQKAHVYIYFFLLQIIYHIKIVFTMQFPNSRQRTLTRSDRHSLIKTYSKRQGDRETTGIVLLLLR